MLTDKEAILLLPPELIAAPHVVNMDWSPDSRNVVAVRVKQSIPTPTRPTQAADISITVWNSATLHSQEPWKRSFPDGGYPMSSLEWLPTTSNALQEIVWTEKTTQPGPDNKPIETTQSKQCLLWIDGQRGYVKEIPEEPWDNLSISPTRPYAVIIHGMFTATPDHSLTLTPVRSDGSVGTPVTTPANIPIDTIYWSEDGSLFILVFLEKLPDKKGVLPHFFAFDPHTGSITQLTKEPAHYKASAPAHPQALRVKSTVLKAQEGDTILHIPALWLETTDKSEQQRTLITGDGRDGKLAPNGNAVLYQSQGAAWVIPFYRISKEEFKTAQLKARRTVIVSNGKQLGLALLMWAADNDENLPSPDGVNAEITPYLKNDALFDGFNYTYQGGPLSDIADPANTILGTVDGPGGVAVIYADGHVKWRNQ
ncbi:MAG TPA: hypothetical protein VKU00_20325 [Chthonomonadaceae bacterium]|nr:hypothetical protein [Chthonomonadaceae bacterium]